MPCAVASLPRTLGPSRTHLLGFFEPWQIKSACISLSSPESTGKRKRSFLAGPSTGTNPGIHPSIHPSKATFVSRPKPALLSPLGQIYDRLTDRSHQCAAQVSPPWPLNPGIFSLKLVTHIREAMMASLILTTWRCPEMWQDKP